MVTGRTVIAQGAAADGRSVRHPRLFERRAVTANSHEMSRGLAGQDLSNLKRHRGDEGVSPGAVMQINTDIARRRETWREDTPRDRSRGPGSMQGRGRPPCCDRSTAGLSSGQPGEQGYHNDDRGTPEEEKKKAKNEYNDERR